jgi:hypothetical protein
VGAGDVEQVVALLHKHFGTKSKNLGELMPDITYARDTTEAPFDMKTSMQYAGNF